MNRLKLFVSNFLIYGIGSVISKIIPFIMLPVITRIIPNASYIGINDIFSIIVSFAVAAATMGMYDAMFRMFFEKNEDVYQKGICSTAFTFILITSAVICCVMLLFSKCFAVLLFGKGEYQWLVVMAAASTVLGTINSIIMAPTRINNQRKIFLITNTITPVISYTVSIPLLLGGRYVIALPLASLISASVTGIIFGLLNHKWFSVRRFNRRYLKDMLVIAVPILPQFLIYWIFNSTDRLMLARLIGNDAVGIYSVGGKVGHISQLIYTAFAGGWQYFAFSTMKDAGQVSMISGILEYLAAIAFAATAIVAALSEVMFTVLFPGEYRQASIIMPYLFVSPLLLMLIQVAGSQFLVIKKTWPASVILGIGALVNVILNALLIPEYGIEGAALGTLIGYGVSAVLCIGTAARMHLLKITNRFLLQLILFSAYLLVWRIWFNSHTFLAAMTAAALAGIYIFLYRAQLGQLIGEAGCLKKKKS